MGQTNRLSARGVANAGPGYHHDGGGLAWAGYLVG